MSYSGYLTHGEKGRPESMAAQKSRAKHQTRTNRPPTRSTAPRQQTTVSSLKPDIEASAAAAEQALGGQPLPAPPPEEQPVTDPAAVADLWQKARQIQLTYEKLASDLDERTNGLASNEGRLAQLQQELNERETGVKEEETANRERTEALDNREQMLLKQVRDQIAERNRGKERMLAELRNDLEAVQKQYDQQRQAFDEELERARARLTDELAAQRKELDDQRKQFDADRAQLRKWRQELTAKEEDLQDTEAIREERVKQAVDAATEELQQRCRHLEEARKRARAQADNLERQADALDELERAFGHRDPDLVLQELDQLRADRAELHRLRLRGVDDDLANRLAAVVEERDQLQERYDTLAATYAQLERQQAAYEMDMASLQRLKLTAEGWQATAEAYQQAVEDLTLKQNELLRRQSTAPPFPECTKLDVKYDDEFDQLVEQAPALPQLVDQVHNFIAKQHQLYYPEDDLRCFLAGLAASRLHLLEGISGIGKTQLPQRFAEAIGAESAVVSVGADWRTPQDLMGYYNAFERRFYESEFTQALYRAQCAWFESRPFLLVLDEMNLSHPEQYFNDVLSALEKDARPDAAPELVLMSAGVEPQPRHLIEGRKLLIPPNVWFCGTANQDETTVSFADKTYDRAHVMQLPDRPQRFNAPPTDPAGPLSRAALDKAFRAARSTYRDETGRVMAFLNERLREDFAAGLRLSWGERLYRQLRRFTPVYIAAGGSVSDATDHLVATKILRKLRGRYEIRVDLLRQLHRDLPTTWKKLDQAGDPRKSLHVLEEEIHKRGESA